MNFFSPWNLLWLAPLLGGILALWMLRRKRQEVTVASLFLWTALLQDTQADTPFQKLRRNFLLFLQILVAFLLIFALARPFVPGRGLTDRRLVVLIDTSAPMSATDVRPTRLEAAKDAAKDFLRREMNGSDVAAVLSTGAHAGTRIGLTADRARLEDAIDKIRGTDAPGDLTGALTLAQSLTRGRAGAQIRIYTSGAVSPDQTAKLAGIPFGSSQVLQQVTGSPSADNVAITALDARRDPLTGRTEVFVAVRHFGSHDHVGGTLSLLQDGKLIDARALLFTGGPQTETFDMPSLDRGGVITARLDEIRDDLATDNEASLILTPPVKHRILLVSQGNPFLENGLNVDQDVALEECAPAQFAAEGKSGAGYDLVVFDGVLPRGTLPPGNFLVFHATSRQTPLVPLGPFVDTPGLVDELRTHPVMRFVDLTGLHVRIAPRLRLAPGAVALAEGDNGPWIAARDTNGRRMISVAFDLADSDWPLRVSFPIFLSNALEWLTAGSQPGATAQQTLPGQPFFVAVPAGSGTISVVRPDGHSSAVAASASSGLVSVTDTARAGLYHVRAGNGADFPAAVDLLDPTASDLTPRRLAALNRLGVTPAPSSVPPAKRAKQELWPAVAAVALAALLLEWIVYHRRIG